MGAPSKRRHHTTGMRYGRGHAPHHIPALKYHGDPDAYPLRVVAIDGRWITGIDDQGRIERMWTVRADELQDMIDEQWGGFDRLPPATRSRQWSVLAVSSGVGTNSIMMVSDRPTFCQHCPRSWRTADRRAQEVRGRPDVVPAAPEEDLGPEGFYMQLTDDQTPEDFADALVEALEDMRRRAGRGADGEAD